MKQRGTESVSHLETTEVGLVHCTIVNSDYQLNSRAFYTFVPNKSLGQVLDIPPPKKIFLKYFNSEISYIEVRFTDRNSEALELEDKINITLVIN